MFLCCVIDLLSSGKLPTVLEEHGNENVFNKNVSWEYSDMNLNDTHLNVQVLFPSSTFLRFI